MYTRFQHKTEGKSVLTRKTWSQHLFIFVAIHMEHPVLFRHKLILFFRAYFLPIEGGPPPGLLAVIPWPLLDNNMILFPVEPAAATIEEKFVKLKYCILRNK